MKDKIICIVSSDAKPIKRLIEECRQERRLIDATSGRRTRAVIATAGGHIILSSLHPQTLSQRVEDEKTQ